MAIQELLASEPLDPAGAEAVQQLMGATGRIWADWRTDPIVTDPDRDAFGVGGFVGAIDSQGRTVDLQLDLFFPPDAAGRASPIVLVFHGGG